MTATVRPVARDHCLAPTRSIDAPVYGGRYDRMFPQLPSLESPESLIAALGATGGLCDGTEEPEGGDDAVTVAAGWPFFGQFLAHDLTADRSALTRHADISGLRNFRSPRLDLDAVYAEGPAGSPYLYDTRDLAKLLLGVNDRGREQDVPRNRQGTAIIGDPRNDVHLFVSQLHVAFLKLHNGLVDRLRADGVAEGDLFEEARRAARWHYQWVILHDYLPGLIGEALAEELRTEGARWYRPRAEPYIPLEFADAAFRYGHSQIRHAYRLNDEMDPLPLLPDLMQLGRPVPDSHVVDWSRMFDVPGARPAQRAKRIDGRLAGSLMRLPEAITGELQVDAHHSLAVRDLERGQATGLPSGEAVAALFGVTLVDRERIGLPEDAPEGTPLWFYILREAEVSADGERLGPVGGRIVGEVLIGVIDGDPGSYRVVDPSWRPTLPAAVPGAFGLVDLLRFAAT